MKSVRVFISGHVQGVGYRAWLVREANLRGLRGWVRNVGHARVEAVICGAPEAVDACIAACWDGPPAAWVEAIDSAPTELVDCLGFECMRSV